MVSKRDAMTHRINSFHVAQTHGYSNSSSHDDDDDDHDYDDDDDDDDDAFQVNNLSLLFQPCFSVTFHAIWNRV